jgi:hypothetical protein
VGQAGLEVNWLKPKGKGNLGGSPFSRISTDGQRTDTFFGYF